MITKTPGNLIKSDDSKQDKYNILKRFGSDNRMHIIIIQQAIVVEYSHYVINN